MTAEDPAEELQMPIAVFENAADNRPAQHHLPWHAFAERLCRFTERPVKDGKAWSPVTYLPNSTRGKANVERVHALVMDVDHGEIPRDLLDGRELAAHTTHSHTPEAPRWRVILPLSRSVEGKDWPDFWLRANAFFGGCIDPATKDSSRIFYLPSCPPGAEHKEWVQHGTLLDPDSLPEVPVYRPPLQAHKPRVLERYMGRWAQGFAEDRLNQLATMPRDSGRNDACNRLAHLLGGLIADGRHELDEHWVVDQLLEACVSNYLVGDDGERSVRATIRSGLESGLMRPWSPADQVEDIPTPLRPPTSQTGKSRATTTEPRIEVERMDTVVAEVIDWLWRNRVARGKATLMMGDPGLGKSLISHWLASTVSVGGEWPDGGQCPQGGAILFTIEDGLADTVKPRLMAAGADTKRVVAVRAVVEGEMDERMFALESHLAQLEQLIVEEHAVLVVFDPITAYLGPNINSHKEDDVRRVLGPLQLMAERTNVALLLLMHLNKGTGIQALYRASGSIAFPAVCRLVLGVAADPNDSDGKRRVLIPVKLNIAPDAEGIGYRIETTKQHILQRVDERDQPPVMVWDNDPVTIDAASAMDRAGTAQERGVLAECKRAIEQIRDEVLARGDDRLPSRDAERQLKEAGVSTAPATLSRARQELGITFAKEGARGMWWWCFSRARARNPVYTENTETREASGDSRLSRDSRDSRVSSRARARSDDDNEQELRYCTECLVHLVATTYAAHLREQHPRGERCSVHGQYFDEHDCDAVEAE